MATKNGNVTNVFASPWNDSDMVLVVEDRELHVHKWILTSQSPVFKVMFDGHFRKAGQDKITLKEKNFQSMVQFMKLLYPSSMFRNDNSPLNDESLLSIMVLANEYQCVNLIQQCIDQVKITPDNVLRILPYALKYYEKALPRLYSVINASISTSKLEKVLPKLEGKQISESNMMLLAKCRFLESSVFSMQDVMLAMMCDILNLKNIPTHAAKSTLIAASTSKFTRGTQCSHSISVHEISKVKGCIHCKENYKEKFISQIPSCQNRPRFFDMLQTGNEISTSLKK